MAEVVQSRPAPARGRSTGRAGRGGSSSGQGRRSGTRQLNNEGAATSTGPSLDEQGELGQLKKQYLSQLETLKELFPDWTDDDLVFALQETDGDLQRTIERITEGNVSQFADVKKKTKEKSRSKKEVPVATESHSATARGRGRGGLEGGRGGRARGTERGVRGRGGRVVSTTGPMSTRATSGGVSVPTTESTAWGDSAVNMGTVAGTWEQSDSTTTQGAGWDSAAGQPATLEPTMVQGGDLQKSSIIPEGSKKSWASMLAQPKPPPTAPKIAPAAAISTSSAPIDPEPTVQIIETHSVQDADGQQITTTTISGNEYPATLSESEIAPTYPASIDSGAQLAPPKDSLTEDNLENLPDESIPAATETTASTRDANSAVGGGMSYDSQSIPTSSRPPMGGYATTAWKATGAPGRTASFQRRMMEQREAVVMPGNHAVDRAAVQFGSMGLNGENRPLDIDDDREEAQTRMQPQQSPPSQPRASLPPAPRQPPVADQQMAQEPILTPKQAPGLPQPPALSASNQPLSQLPLTSQNLNQPGLQTQQAYGQYGRFQTGNLSQEAGAPTPKQYDPFSQQLNYTQGQQDAPGVYPAHSQASNPMPQAQAPPGAFSHGQNEYGSQYSAEQQRGAYQNFYGSSYGQQNVSSHQDQNVAPQRSGSGFATADSGYGSTQPTASHPRYGDSQNSGNTTPNPAIVSQQQMSSQPQQQGQPIPQQPHGQASHGGNYPYGNPYYYSSSYNSYMNQYPNNYYGQQGYGAPFSGKGNMYGQPHHTYGISPQGSYEHSSSPANAQAFGSTGQSRDNSMAGSAGEYGRSGSAQPSLPNTSAAGAFPGTAVDGFGRGAAGFSQNQQYAQQGQAGDDALKAFGETKSGPSPSMGQAGRAGSAVHSSPYGGHSNYPPHQSHQQGFPGYPSHLTPLQGSHTSQYGGIGGLGGHQGTAQSHQAGGYGYGGAGFSGNSYTTYGRGGWGGNYGH